MKTSMNKAARLLLTGALAACIGAMASGCAQSAEGEAMPEADPAVAAEAEAMPEGEATEAAEGGEAMPEAEATEAAAGNAITVANDTVVEGDLDRYVPEVEQAAEEGASLSFDEESNLQQEKTAGFSGGAVTSSLEALSAGITDWLEAEPAGFHTPTGEPPALSDIAGMDVPASHIANGVTAEQCGWCHH